MYKISIVKKKVGVLKKWHIVRSRTKLINCSLKTKRNLAKINLNRLQSSNYTIIPSNL